MNQLEQLKAFTKVVADTGDIQTIKIFFPEDATTNPSLVLKAAQQKQYQTLLQACIKEAQTQSTNNIEKNVIEIFSVKLGIEISKIIPGRISTEVDASLSFDTKKMIEAGKQIISLYELNGVDRSRILIKLAATWEGIQAAKELEQEGINCNITLIFNFYQALAAAQASVFLISPFVGRILDWHKKANPEENYIGLNDPGVISVRQIYNHFKQHNYKTVVMGASFRNIEEIQALAGCDRLTISPELMQKLKDTTDTLPQALKAKSQQSDVKDFSINETEFRWLLNQDAMATEKLSEGIRNFTIDQIKLEKVIRNLL
jgi:transaldolase